MEVLPRDDVDVERRSYCVQVYLAICDYRVLPFSSSSIQAILIYSEEGKFLFSRDVSFSNTGLFHLQMEDWKRDVVDGDG
jgi:hypothetical protein